MTYREMFGGTATLTGRSGTGYEFTVFPRFTTFKPNGGVFVMGRQTGAETFEFCFIGQTADLSVRPLQPDKTSCFQRFGVDHIFIIEEPDAASRAKVAADLIGAYQPSCNAP